jgi:hypothetical protein
MISNEAMHNDLLDQQRQQQITGSIPIIQKGGSGKFKLIYFNFY